MHSRMSKPTKGRLKRSSFIHHSKMLGRQQPELLDHMPEPIQTHAAVPCWERQKFPIIFTHIPGTKRKAAQSDPERRSMTLEHISAIYPEEEWTQVCTDGSAIEGAREEVQGSTSPVEQKCTSLWQLGGTPRTESMVLNTAETLANL